MTGRIFSNMTAFKAVTKLKPMQADISPSSQVLLAMVIGFLCSGCSILHYGTLYGFVSPDAVPVREDGMKVSMPKNASTISQGFTPLGIDRNGDKTSVHEGIDITGLVGLPIIAPAPGTVIHVSSNRLYGNRIFVEHGRNTDGKYIRTRYFHLEEIQVKEGDKVVRGQQIGLMGRTGILALYPHLHFEVRTSDSSDKAGFDPVTPHKYWADGVGIVTCFESGKQVPDLPFKITYPVPCKKE